jgi:hypothetical protein
MVKEGIIDEPTFDRILGKAEKIVKAQAEEMIAIRKMNVFCGCSWFSYVLLGEARGGGTGVGTGGVVEVGGP